MWINYMYRFSHPGYDTSKLRLIGQGHEGMVYMLSDDRVVKIFHNPASCKRQVDILQRAQVSRFFPTVFSFDEYSIVMSFVEGVTLANYLKHYKIDKNISLELVRLIDDFKKLGFTRLDMRLGHIFLQPYGTLKVIDPRGSYDRVRPYPLSMLKGLRKNGCLKDFLKHIKDDYPEYYNYWRGVPLR